MHTPAWRPLSAIPLIVVYLVTVLCVAVADTDTADAWKTKTNEWLKLEQRLAADSRDWLSEKETLEASRTVLEHEQAKLKERLESNELAGALFRKRRMELEAELATQKEAKGQLNEGLDEIEARLGQLYTLWPPPLQERISPLVARLRAGTEDNPVTVSERTQTVISILSAIDQFNNTVTLTHHLRPNEGGGEVDVQVLYWGLAMGYGVDAARNRAWTLNPSDDGWVWSELAGAGPRVRELLEIYERTRSPALVQLPARLQEVNP